MWESCVRKSGQNIRGRDAIEFNDGRFDVFQGPVDRTSRRAVEVSVITRQVAVSDKVRQKGKV